ncbi:MAG: DNA-binding protein [Clostridiales bacterium]|nr:DNA-binding protein [Clostridiales bacterium]
MKPFMKIPQASRETGLSQYFLRRGCRNGTIPFIRDGRIYLINVPAMLEQLDNQSKETA